MSLITQQIPSMPKGLRPEDIERILRSMHEDIKQLTFGVKGVIVNTKDISSAYTVSESDDILMCWGDTTISLGLASDITGKMYWIKDISTSQVTIDASVQVDDVTRVNIDASQSLCIVSNGSEWRIVSGYQI
ncbi:MAG: hypothetical protein MUO31_06915 [Thermodesulfovibrionales bacterium]|nr:hypothetical protein [Thermodesulfovibrionales bacterium]